MFCHHRHHRCCRRGVRQQNCSRRLRFRPCDVCHRRRHCRRHGVRQQNRGRHLQGR